MNAPAKTGLVGDNRPPLVTLDQLKVDFAHVEKGIAELEAEAAKLPPVAEDSEDMELVTAFAGKLIKAAKRCEAIRNEQNRPHIDAQNINNDFFTRDLIRRLDAAKTKIEIIGKAYLKKKAAREQAIRDEQAAEARKKADAAAALVANAVKAGDVVTATVAVAQSNAATDVAAKATAAAAAPTSSLASTTTDAGNATLVDNWVFADLDVNTIDLEVLRPFFAQAAIEQALRQYIKAGRREIAGARIFNDPDARYRARKD
jgi:hypothetical protein